MTRSTAAAEWIGRAPRRAGEWLLATAFGLLLAGGAVALLVHDPKQGWAAALAKIAIAAVGIGLTAIYISFAFGRRAVLRLEGRRLELIVGARRRVLATDEAGIKLGEWWHPRLGAMGLVLYLEGG
ncbi:MAG: hypothetical protein KC609_21930, partial [Myxococcales bacterium]|nr:hypothetical protein [Myxococcales bacterium]